MELSFLFWRQEGWREVWTPSSTADVQSGGPSKGLGASRHRLWQERFQLEMGKTLHKENVKEVMVGSPSWKTLGSWLEQGHEQHDLTAVSPAWSKRLYWRPSESLPASLWALKAMKTSFEASPCTPNIFPRLDRLKTVILMRILLCWYIPISCSRRCIVLFVCGYLVLFTHLVKEVWVHKHEESSGVVLCSFSYWISIKSRLAELFKSVVPTQEFWPAWAPIRLPLKALWPKPYVVIRESILETRHF